MTPDLDLLTPEFREKIDELLAKCNEQGVVMRPNEGLRDPFTQARYWRQSRSSEQIAARIASLNSEGAPFLAYCLDSVGPQYGAPVTNSIPGLGWHQWGEALDCFWVVNGQAEWSAKRLVNGRNGFQVYAAIAGQIGLTSGGTWSSLKDWPHVQLRSAASPLGAFTLQQIDATMKQRFGATPSANS